MSIRIALSNPPEFYTNLDVISGKIILGINRPEQVGAVIVKLEGESKTALGPPDATHENHFGAGKQRRSTATDNSQIFQENHKVLYKVLQVFPNENVPAYAGPMMLNPGQHEWPFRFKVPFNNACGDPNVMAKIGGLAGAGGFAGPSLFGMGGIRLMDGTKQLLYTHVTKTLPPSFTGSVEAEIRYYIKVTIQRPGLFKENWRHQIGFKFMPIEPPRPPESNQEAYARRPFTFRPKSPGIAGLSQPKRQSMFSRKQSSHTLSANGASTDNDQPPSIEISARLPHPSILTCNKAIPLRILAKKLVDTRAECYLVSLQIDLVGSTAVQCQHLVNTDTTRWVVASRHGFALPLQRGPDDAVGTETEINDVLWTTKPLPNTVMPSFVTCNIKRSYALELKLGVSWGKPPGDAPPIPDEPAPAGSKASKTKMGKSKGKGKEPVYNLAQTIFLPLHFSSVQVYSGLTPPESLAQAARENRRRQTQQRQRPQQQQRPSARPNAPSASQSTPTLPPRQTPQQDPLYPPQLRPGQVAGQARTSTSPGLSAAGDAVLDGAAPPYDDAPPSYDEAMAETMTEPVVPDGQARPAWSGVTNENGPANLPEKS
ncbi:Arrestin-related trafficking adapter 10 [Cytospora mali]|uniref:Arrestin-related trafficking adapter 10 n=1 Tax=Cytospora mali TaxID=578113 RepID=A0A194WA16_CYTMA|nr:Arrestin-related trafficking adapter 10 [Valsa mali]